MGRRSSRARGMPRPSRSSAPSRSGPLGSVPSWGRGAGGVRSGTLPTSCSKTPRDLEILGDGKQSKDYMSVKDCIEGIMLGYEKSSGRVNIFNLGLQEQTTVDELADLVIEEMGLSNVKKGYTGGASGWVGDNPVVYPLHGEGQGARLGAQDVAYGRDKADREMDAQGDRLAARCRAQCVISRLSRVAVTGGAGFLGSHIVRRLVADGREVSIVDDLSSGSVENLRDLGVAQKCVVGDLRDYGFAKVALRGRGDGLPFRCRGRERELPPRVEHARAGRAAIEPGRSTPTSSGRASRTASGR